MSGIYWGLTALDLMNVLDRMDKDEVLSFVRECQHQCGGFGASVGHDPHLLYTLSAIQASYWNIYCLPETYYSLLPDLFIYNQAFHF